jgi:hypothetical protein
MQKYGVEKDVLFVHKSLYKFNHLLWNENQKIMKNSHFFKKRL